MPVTPDGSETPMEAQLLVAVTRLETKIDALLAQSSDHEARLRALESKPTISPRQLWTTIVSACSVIIPLAGLLASLF